MKKDQLAFLLGGLSFGFLVGFGFFHTTYESPDLQAGTVQAQSPMPPQATSPAPTQPAPTAGAGAPMVAEINRLKQLLQDDPDNLAALVRLGNLHFDVQMWDQAAGYYERAVELDPDDPDLLTDLGTCYRGMSEYEKALTYFERAHDSDPTHWQSLFNTAIVAGFDLKQYDRALQALSDMEAMNPQPPQLARLRQELERARASGTGGAS